LLSGNSNKVLGIHHLGGDSCDRAYAVRIDKVWEKVKDIFDNKVPEGKDGIVTTATATQTS